MVHERMKLEGKSQFGLGNVLPRIQINEQQQANVQQHSDTLPINENQPAKEDFMGEFIDLVKTLGSRVSKMAEKLKLTKELFPNNLLIKSVEVLIEKRLKDPSISSQDEEVFGKKSLLKAIDQVEREYLEKKLAEKRAAKGKQKIGDDFDPANAWSLGIDESQTPIENPAPQEAHIGVGSVASRSQMGEDSVAAGKRTLDLTLTIGRGAR